MAVVPPRSSPSCAQNPPGPVRVQGGRGAETSRRRRRRGMPTARDANGDGCQSRALVAPRGTVTPGLGERVRCQGCGQAGLSPPGTALPAPGRAGGGRLAPPQASGSPQSLPCRVALVGWQDLALPPQSAPPLLPGSLSTWLLAGHRPPWDLPSLHVPLWTALALPLLTEAQECLPGLGGPHPAGGSGLSPSPQHPPPHEG